MSVLTPTDVTRMLNVQTPLDPLHANATRDTLEMDSGVMVSSLLPWFSSNI